MGDLGADSKQVIKRRGARPTADPVPIRKVMAGRSRADHWLKVP